MQESPAEADGLLDAIRSEDATHGESTAEPEAAARAEAVRAAMGTPEGYVSRAHLQPVRPVGPVALTVVPAADETGDAILGEVKAHAEASRQKARLRQADALRAPDTSMDAKRPTTIDPAVAVMSDPDFYKLSASEQAARVCAARSNRNRG